MVYEDIIAKAHSGEKMSRKATIALLKECMEDWEKDYIQTGDHSDWLTFNIALDIWIFNI